MDRDNEIGLSRRGVLGALGSIGVASVGAGLGTSAYFSDQETFQNNQLTAGTLDMKVGWSEYYLGRTADGPGVREYGGTGTGDASDLNAGETGLPTEDAWVVAVDDPEGFLDGIEQESVEIDADPCGGLDVPEGLASQGGDRPVISLSDLKPGDFGGVGFEFALCSNPGYVRMNAALDGLAGNGLTEPEADDPDETGGVIELLDQVRVAIWVDDGGDGPGGNADDNYYQNGGESPVFVDSLRNALSALSTGTGLGLDGNLAGGGDGPNCFSADADGDGADLHSVVCAYWLPPDTTNQVQSDSVTFDLGLFAEQCRHNDGVGLSTDLVAHYPFDHNTDDVSGNGFDGSIANQVTYVDGHDGDAMAFDGSDGYVNVPDASGLDGFDAVTVATWVRLDGAGDVANTLVRKNGAYLLQRTSDGFFSFAVWDGGLADWRSVSTRAFDASDYGTWHHVAGVFDPSGPSYRLYLDGSEVDATSTSATAVDASAAPLTLGGMGEQFSLDGALDDVRVYARALSASEVQALYDSS